MREETYYELLQVSPSADLEIITGAYRALIRRHHPDRNPSPSAEATTKRLNEAWEVLSDPERRAEYDQTFAAGSTSRPASPPRQPNRPTQGTSPPKPKQPSPPPGMPDWVNGGLTVVGIVFALGLTIFLVVAALAQS